MGVIDSLRATEENRIKAVQVLRGKRDAVLQGHWPGGTAPFGHKLESVMCERKGRQEVDYCILKRDPESDWVIMLLFQMARETGWGTSRLARFLNDRLDIPGKFKPFQASVIGRWLNNTIYYGELRWGQYSTDVIDDARVIQRNGPEDVLCVPSFCEPLVDRATWDAVHALRALRAEKTNLARSQKATSDGKLIKAPSPGLALKYLLTGLVHCGHCGRAMTPGASTVYVDKAGRQKRYVRYLCPAHAAGVCQNSRTVPEDWLRATVIGKLRDVLFPCPTE
jgi:hypothetical protein